MTRSGEQRSELTGNRRHILIGTGCPHTRDVLSSAFRSDATATTVVSGGKAVLERLIATAEETEGEGVDMLVLGLGLSDIDCRTVLTAVRSSPLLQTLPVVVVGEEAGATEEVGPSGANGVLERADDDEFRRGAHAMAEFWGEHVALPRRD